MAQNDRGWRSALRAAFPHTIPVLTGFFCLGVAYGLLMETKGYGPFWSTLMSLVCYCGSMQYAAIALLTTVFDPVQAFLLSLMVNARHLFYGVSMLRKYAGLGSLRPLLIYWLTDETFSVLCTVDVPEGVERGHFYFWVSFLDYCYWGAALWWAACSGACSPSTPPAWILPSPLFSWCC